MSSNYTTHNLFLTNKKQNIINKGDDIMSYYINHALKLTFKEYNKFVKHCREYIDDDIMYKFNISDKDILNGTFMDKLFEDIFMDNDSMCINTTCSVLSPKYDMMIDFINKEDEKDNHAEYGYASIGEQGDDIEMVGFIDNWPYIRIDNDMDNEIKLKPGVLKIIID